MLTIGILSDTHGLLRPEAAAILEGCDHILHAGDIGRAEVITALSALAPVTAVRGNVDSGAWAEAFPEQARVTLGGRIFLVLHDRKALDHDPTANGIDVVVSGHSHRPLIETLDGVLHINPGSAGPRRFRLPIALVTLEIGQEAGPHCLRPRLHELAL